MPRILRHVLASLLLALSGASFTAGAAPAPAAFGAALYETPVGNNAAEALFLVNVLRRAEAPKPHVEALQRELLHRYLGQLTAPAAASTAPAPAPGLWARLKQQLPGKAKPPKNDISSAIARGRQREDVFSDPFRADWQAAYNQAVAVRWEEASRRAPYFTLEMRDMQPLLPGVWAATSSDGQVRLMLALRLANTSAVPVPIYRPDIVLQGALRFTCNWDRAARTQSVMQANEVTLLPPGAESDPLACETAPAPGHWREQLAAQAASAKPALQALLVPHDLDSPNRAYHTELAFAHAAPQGRAFSERLLLARQEPARQWSAAERALEPPESSNRFGTAPHRGWPATSKLLAGYLGGTVLALALFAGGRAMRRAQVPETIITLVTVLAAGALWAGATYSLGGGTGYSHPFYVGLALWAGYLGPLLLCVLALHGLHKLLDAEQLAWWQTVATGWRNTFNISAETSRAEFWGFLAHCAWLWALARICLAPLDWWVGLALLVPLGTLTFRRVRSMSGQEWVAVGVAVGCLVLIALA